MTKTVLRDQPYTSGIKSLLAAEKALLIFKERRGRHVATTDATIAAVDAFARSDRRVSISICWKMKHQCYRP